MVTIINMWLRLGSDCGYAVKKIVDRLLETGNRTAVSCIKVSCFIDSFIHPDFLPVWILSLHINVTSSFAPIIITVVT